MSIVANVQKMCNKILNQTPNQHIMHNSDAINDEVVYSIRKMV